jgi:GWxTD domain-containing protein
MAISSDSPSKLLVLLWMLVSIWVGSCRSTAAPNSGQELRRWAEGPVSWLLQPEEWKHMRQADGPGEAMAFIEEFWARRDPDPATEGNAFRESFFRRVEAADILYSEDSREGSMTDRGRALILLGSPSVVRIGSESTLAWEQGEENKRGVGTRDQRVEIWGYRLEDLPVNLVRMATASKKSNEAVLELTLTFVIEPRRAHLHEGEELLKLAARSTVQRP